MRYICRRVLLGCCAVFFVAAASNDQRHWQSGKIVRFERAPTHTPLEWRDIHPWLPDSYTIATETQVLRATEMLFVRVTSRGELLVSPPSFVIGQAVKVAIQDPPPRPPKLRELYVVGKDGKIHILTLDASDPTKDERSLGAYGYCLLEWGKSG